jgi:hypothetical protein
MRSDVVLGELSGGGLGVAQVRELGRARANPRIGADIVEAIGVLVGHAQHLPFHEFRICVRRWERSPTSMAPTVATTPPTPVVRRMRRSSVTSSAWTPTAASPTARRSSRSCAFEQAEFDAEWAERRFAACA